MLPKAPRLWALLCLLLVFQLATAQSFQVVRRRDDAPTTTATAKTDGHDGAHKTSADSTVVETDTAETKKNSDRTKTASGTESETAKAPLPSATISTDGPLDNSTLKNVTIGAGELPLPPHITPGWGVAGAIMVITGVAYALIGIRNQWISTFFSTTYLTSLAVTVLICYVMALPVSDAVQGGYVAAVVLSGCAIGAGSTFFKELTEGLGCALGGFCVSMWLLCLVPGGLLHPVPSKAIFIACFSLVGFAFYFSRWTRDWALITMISFAGGTVAVLGIDCFSRAGLKEFWAYVWNLNDNLFPFGTQTYPVTKGIRVETAAIVIIFLVGIMSQMKLWRVVREQKEKRAAERAEAQRDLEKEEENVGRQLEETNAQERRQWERIYGDGEVGSSTVSRSSDVADSGAEKKLKGDHRDSSAEDIEMADLSESGREPNHLMAAEDGEEGKVMVRVAADDVPESPADEGHPVDEKAATVAHKNVSRVSEVPEVVPLPFTVPQEDETRSHADRSSVATFADDEGLGAAAPVHRRSLVKRLSHNSVTFMRSMSPRSGHAPSDWHGEGGESAEDLVAPKSEHHDRDNGSVVATLDDESLSGSERHSVVSPNEAKSFEINAELSEREAKQALPEHTADPVEVAPVKEDPSARPFSTDTVSTDILKQAEAADDNVSIAPTAFHAPGSVARSVIGPGDGSGPEPSEKPPKSATSTASIPASLTKERLPRSLSRVAMSYRTNEWAKHLSHADAPEPDELRVAEAAQPTKAAAEKPAPVMVEELQQTVEDAKPKPTPAAVRRSDSHASQISNNARSLSRSASKQGMASGSPQEQNPPNRNSSGPGVLRSTSSSMALRRSSSNFRPIVEEGDATPDQPPIAEEEGQAEVGSTSPQLAPTEPAQRAPIPGVVSYASPQTLLGQREMFLRSKSQSNLISSPPVGRAFSTASSDAGSLMDYPMYAAALPVDPDDMPLNQRKQFMRQSSMMSLQGLPQRQSTTEVFDSHQPNRGSKYAGPSVRESQLANFRQSVAVDLRAGSPVVGNSGRETPFASNSLLGSRDAEVQRNIELQRNMLLSQKDAEAQRREQQRREREWANRAFDERMRSGDLLDVHREALRKMQKGAKD